MVRNGSCEGYSLVELITVLAIGGILMSIAVIDMKELDNSSTNGASHLVGFLKEVRAKGLATTRAYTLTPASSNKVVTTYGDSCSSVTQTTDPEMQLTLPSGATMTLTNWTICYSTRGLSNNSADIPIRDSRGLKTVQVALGGGMRIR